jgi:hypothetical protein
MNFDTGGSVEGSPDSHSKCATPSAAEMLWSEKTRRIVILLFSLNVISAALFIGLVNRPVYDDPFNIYDVHNYATRGLSVDSLMSQRNPPGPTGFLWMAAGVRLLHGDELRDARIASLASWLLLGAGILMAARFSKFAQLWYGSLLCLLVFPHAVEAAATVLTEGPAMLFTLLGVLAWTEFASRPNYFKRFYVRRALRILPIFYLILFLLVWMLSQSRAFLWMSFFYLSNIAPLFGIPMTYPILWSLSVAEHFYFFWPFVVRKISSQGVFWVATSISVIVPILRAYHFSPVSFEGFNYLTWLVADGLAMGAILAAVYVRQPQCTRESLARVSIGAMALAVLIFAAGASFGILSRIQMLGASLLLTAAHLFFTGLVE